MEDYNKKKKIIFDVPGDTDTTEIIDEIMKKNGLKENLEEYFNKLTNNEEPKLIIIRDSAMVLAQKRVPEQKLIELLKEHLEITQDIAEKIISDIKEKLIPYVKIIDVEEEKKEEIKKTEYPKEDFQEQLLDKIRGGVPISKPEIKPKAPMPYDKKPQIKSVEKNAENMNKEGQNTTTKEKNKLPEENKTPLPQEGKSDTYREPIE